MKTRLHKLLIALILGSAISLIGMSDANAWWWGGGWHHCYWVNGHKVCGYNRHCHWVGGFWRNGFWHPRRRVCWN